MNSKLRNILKLLVALICGYLLSIFVDFGLLARVFKELDWAAIVVLLLISFVMVLVSALKWKVLVDFLGGTTSLIKLYALYLVGYYTNLLLPSYLGGDMVRSYYVGKSVGQTSAAAATVLERYTGIVAMIVLALVSSFILDSVNWLMRLWILLLSLGIVLISAITLSKKFSLLLRKLPFGNTSSAQKVFSVFDKLADGFRFAASNRKILCEVFLLSFIFHALTVVNTLACAYAVGWDNAPFWGLSMVIPTILIVSAIPVSPQGIGIQEGAFVFFLTQVGATAEQALGIALILRAKSYVLAMFGGVIYHFRSLLLLSSDSK